MPERDARSQHPAQGRKSAPEGPTDLGGRSWLGAVKRTVREFKEDELSDRAAALTYYGVLAIFPALLALVSILALLGKSTTQPLIDNVGKVAPGATKDIFVGAIKNLEKNRSTGGILFVVGLVVALSSASGYVAAFMRASNRIYDVGEGRPIWKKAPVRLGVTLVTVILLAVSAVAVVVTGTVAKQVGSTLGIGHTAVTVWDIAKWPVLLVIVSLMFAILYWASPNVKQPAFRWMSPGGILAVVVWIVASAAFSFYVATFANYNKTYGTLGGIIIFLVWLYISNVAVFLRSVVNDEVEGWRQDESGHTADKEPFMEPRDTRKLRSA